MNYEITRVEDWHIHYVAENMRLQDQHEIWAQSLSRPLHALQQAVKLSTKSWCGLVEDEPVVIFGVAPLSMIGGIGSPWLLGTDKVESVAITFLKECKQYASEMLAGYDYLENYVDQRNTTSIAWLKWMGFDILDAEPYGAFQIPFHKFRMENEQCVYQH